MTMRLWLPALIAIATLAGCDLYLDDDPPCAQTPPSGGAARPLRNPETGACENFGGGAGGGGCDSCGRCAEPTSIALPDWGSCYSECESLDEDACLVQGGCYAAYGDEYGDPRPDRFLGCRQTAPSGPVRGSCAGLDAHECSRHDDCAMSYELLQDVSAAFAQCLPEPRRGGTCDTVDIDCPPGYHCADECTCTFPGEDCPVTCRATCVSDVPDPCQYVTCEPGSTCVKLCEGDGSSDPSSGATPPMCQTECVPTGQDPGTCTGDVWCNLPEPACPTGTTAGRLAGCWTGYCIPNNACGPNDPGHCDDSSMCDLTAPPACPTGTSPGVVGCHYSGYCIPDAQCPVVACELLATEAACVSRGDCVAVYEGMNCTCDPTGCTCEQQTFDHCQSALMPF